MMGYDDDYYGEVLDTEEAYQEALRLQAAGIDPGIMIQNQDDVIKQAE